MAKDASGTILLLGGLGVAAYGYYAGWFASFGFPAPSSTTASSTTLTAAQLAALQAAAAGTGTPITSPVPSLGTTVTSLSQVQQQAAANDAYIIPDSPTFAALSNAYPAGYQPITTTDKGPILLRPDVYSAVQTQVANTASRAASSGASAQSIQNASQVTLANIQQMMTTAGLSGLGYYQQYLASRMVTGQ